VPVEEARTVRGHAAVPFDSYQRNEQVYIVKRGDTVSNIAYAYYMTVDQLARRNGLLEPYTIYPGQKLVIKNTHKRPPIKPNKVIKTPLSTRLAPSGYKSRKNNDKPIHPRDGNSSHKKVVIEWKWPVRGELVKKFNQGQPPSKGIDISGRYGDPVFAAADGVVVYTGEGLRGFGKMVILLHEGNYLSAYGNNRKIRVREHQSVQKGEIIAEIGSSATKQNQLHFEIRVAGTPVDPLRYLPSRE
jgi:lipoprotein NlpD